MSEVLTIGFKEFGDKLKNVPREILEEVDAECFDAAKYWEQLAKNAAPKDTGRMYQNITSAELGFLEYEVTSPILYSPYQEWGTIQRVSVPADLQAYAIQFKGKGLITKGGIYPHPFFFVQRPEVEKFLVTQITKTLERPR